MEENWRGFAECSYLLEDEFNWYLRLAAFERFARFNTEVLQKCRPQITAIILIYGDILFGWLGNRDYLYREFSKILCNVIFESLQEEPRPLGPALGLRGEQI
ncbi:hypothetical protein [Microbulbifer pacificus]|uniref:hypothetical protein n=1 Tax=Microbulbifer pacificus TaxID=407164 RepID=UPI000CF57ABE|nr:hypothetical protein [Microbulbifer pacificus]